MIIIKDSLKHELMKSSQSIFNYILINVPSLFFVNIKLSFVRHIYIYISKRINGIFVYEFFFKKKYKKY